MDTAGANRHSGGLCPVLLEGRTSFLHRSDGSTEEFVEKKVMNALDAYVKWFAVVEEDYSKTPAACH
ncbi:hypothetical protein JRO89_XS07G0196900 [Xanthoceras sorbifolium]|uniref:Uncharacterized protein n=1 Tax=Xanthoceras sorbifolium TaxID=99658 RepID=A0ABQ8HU94_9ROSI|nr:hypothetical protein JRO89_XS07G0196900 [Xanthoceras sorbifolium]